MTDYQRMTLDELYAVVVDTAVRADDAYALPTSKAVIREHDRWVDINHAALGELESRGAEALRGFIPLLEDPRPPVRLTAAFVVKTFDQDRAVPVLESLRYGKHGHVSSSAYFSLLHMRKQGLLPPE